MNPMDLKRGIDKAVVAAVEAVEEIVISLVKMTKRLRKWVLFLQTLMQQLVRLLRMPWQSR